MNFIKKFNFMNQLYKFFVDEENGGGGNGGGGNGGGNGGGESAPSSGPNTVAGAGLPTSGDDAFKGATYSNLGGATAGYYYDFSKKKKKKRKLKKSFLDYMLPKGKAASYVKEDKENSTDFAMSINKEELGKLFGESVYEFGENKYTVKFYRKGENYRYGKMFFVGNNSFCMRFNKKEKSKNEIDSISFWNKWSTEIINKDL